jgi:hypothetical protein
VDLDRFVFVRLCFGDLAIFLQLIWWSKESASNFVSTFKKLLQKPIKCYRKPSKIMSWAKAKLFYGTNPSRADERLSTTIVDKPNTRKHSKRSRGYPCRP